LWVLYKKFNGLNHLGNSNAAMCKHFKIDNVKAHAALSDAVASAQCLAIMLNKISFS
jgi:DNA polymerase III epsilon subunit-like protein